MLQLGWQFIQRFKTSLGHFRFSTAIPFSTMVIFFFCALLDHFNGGKYTRRAGSYNKYVCFHFVSILPLRR
jgi:hypothetical protein